VDQPIHLDRLGAEIQRRKSELAELEELARLMRKYLPACTNTTPDNAKSPVESENHVAEESDQPEEDESRDGGDGSDLANEDEEQGDLVGLRIVDAASRVLADSVTRWVDYREVTQAALSRGYRGRDPNQEFKSVAQSFYHTMKREAGLFESRGPTFRLRRSR
jgi:hypothetical protein